MSYQGPRSAEDALYRFLADDVYGLNAEITAYRVARGLSVYELPALTSITRWWDPGTQITSKTPALAIVWEGTDGESEPNSRFYDSQFGVAMLLIGADVTPAGSESPEGSVQRAAADYAEAMINLFRRRLPNGEDGWTLGNGAGSLAEGRVIRATVNGISVHTDDSDPTFPNVMILARVTVRLALDY